MIVERLYSMPLRFGYWLLLPFICVYYVFTCKFDRRRFIISSGAGRVVVSADFLEGSFGPEDVAVIREYVRGHPV